MTKKLVITDKNDEFLKKINDISGEIVNLCEQCGTCSGGCPMIEEMDITPSEMMRLVLLGDEDVLNTKTIWICASCFTCTVRCPRKLDLSKVGETLRQIKLRKAIDYIDIKALSKEEIEMLPQIALVSAFRKFTG
jgi:heterodisulfide reductase subunit C2